MLCNVIKKYKDIVIQCSYKKHTYQIIGTSEMYENIRYSKISSKWKTVLIKQTN